MLSYAESGRMLLMEIRQGRHLPWGARVHKSSREDFLPTRRAARML